MRKNEPRILLLDIETLPLVVTTWRLKVEGYLSHENIQGENSIVCAAWKWLGERAVSSASVLSHKSKDADVPDAGILRKLHGAMSEADAVVAHNGDRFDIPWIRTRLLLTDLPTLKPTRTIDTKKIAKRVFMFNSNRLDYLGKRLGLGQKIRTDYDLWLKAMKGDRKAIAEMVRYNREDVRLLERVFLKLRPHVPAALNLNHWASEAVCPTCGSKRIQARGIGVNAVTQYRRFHCQECGAWSKQPMNAGMVR